MRFLMRAMLLVLAFSVAATQGATPPPESAAEGVRSEAPRRDGCIDDAFVTQRHRWNRFTRTASSIDAV